ncbi:MULTISPECIES: RNase P modulator RnpM [Bacillaceae]|uniref:RNase P modulator RnpM n=2 Tax=Bacillales TaxID=1385 RepID=UPI001BDF3D60|nr:YlxR family protein [Cytobacillus sp. IB215316]MDX8362213.1 YlxR family protein [Cytobacillus sp. IB215316]
MKQKKIPMRKCVASGEMRPKKELIRIVRSKEGEVSVDQTGKKAGRGAYLTKDKDIILLARKNNQLSRHLNAQIEDAIYEQLIELVEKEKQSSHE